MEITRELLRRLPKSDLHLHLDGSVRLRTLIELATERDIHLPSQTVEGLRETVFKNSYESLEDYLTGFAYTCAVMGDAESLERIACELALDNLEEGVRYIEVRFAPQLHAGGGLDLPEIFTAVNRGLARARSEFNGTEAVLSGEEPRFEYGIIACSMRFFASGFSRYFDRFMKAHTYTNLDTVFGLASLELVGAALDARDRLGIPVVGVDLAGAEAGYPPAHHREAYLKAHRGFMKKTVHAGEAYGPESIFQAITELNADRIGHGTSLFNAGAVSDPSIDDPERFVEDLAQYIADRRITLEVCLTSNMQTTPSIGRLENHPLGKMIDHRLSVAICTDNRTVSHTTVTDELHKVVRNFDVPLPLLKNLVVYGFKRSFFPGPYQEKRRYVRQCMERFERVVAEAGGEEE
ncbi:MAG: adenosine deaminase family protein [Candidatus Fermentibacterota bacterium]